MEGFPFRRRHGEAIATANAQVDLNLRYQKPMSPPPHGPIGWARSAAGGDALDWRIEHTRFLEVQSPAGAGHVPRVCHEPAGSQRWSQLKLPVITDTGNAW